MTIRQSFEQHWVSVHKNGQKGAIGKLRRDEEQPDVYAFDSTNRHWVTWQAAISRQEAKINALEQVIAQEQSKTIRNCITCKYSHEPANSAVCTDCKHAYTSADHWEPKP